MSSTRLVIFFVVLVVVGVLFFKPKVNPVEPVTMDSISTSEPMDPKSAEKVPANPPEEKTAVLAKKDALQLPKGVTMLTSSATPSPSTEAAASPLETPPASSDTSGLSALKKLNDRKIKGVFKMPNAMDINPDQKAFIDQVEKKFTPQLEAQLNKMEDLLSEDQKRARNDALIHSVFDGDRPDVRFDVVRNAMNLTGEQEQRMREINREFTKMRTTARQEIYQSLSPEQKNSLPPNWLGGRRSGSQ